MAVAHAVPIPRNKIRTGEELIGDKDGINTVFYSPENFLWDFGSDGIYFEFFRNGQLQVIGAQYVILLSNNKGIGIRMFRPPRPHDSLLINYVSI